MTKKILKMDLQLFAYGPNSDYVPNIWGPTDESPVLTYSIDSDRRDLDVSKEIANYLPDATPFLVVLMRARKVATPSTEFKWYDKEPASWWTEVTSGYGDDAVSDDEIIVDDATICKPKDIIKNAATGEVMRIIDVSVGAGTSAPGGTWEVARQYGYDDTLFDDGTQAASGSTGDNIMRMGNAMEENSLSPQARATQPNKFWNYVQTFRTPFSASNDVTEERLKTSPNERNRLRQEKLVEHRLDIERAMLFGEKMESLDDDVRMTGGLLQHIETNAYDVGQTNGGVLTEAEFENFCKMGFQWKKATKDKLFVCSSKVGAVINQFAAGRIQTVSGEKAYGLQLNEYQSFHGKLYIATCESFEKDYDGMGIMLDVGNLEYRPFAGKDSTLQANIQENDRDGWKDEYMTKAGLAVRLEKTHAILDGVAS